MSQPADTEPPRLSMMKKKQKQKHRSHQADGHAGHGSDAIRASAALFERIRGAPLRSRTTTEVEEVDDAGDDDDDDDGTRTRTRTTRVTACAGPFSLRLL